MRCVLEWESSTTYVGYPERLLTCTLICEMTQKKGYTDTVDKARNYDKRYLHSRHSCQSGHTSTGDHALQEYPATKYEYTRGHQGNIGHKSISKVCRYTYTDFGQNSSQPTKAVSSIRPRS